MSTAIQALPGSSEENKQHEQIVLCGMLRSASGIIEAQSLLAVEDFYFYQHQEMFRAIGNVWASSPSGVGYIDGGLVAAQLVAKDSGIDWSELISDILDTDPTGAWLLNRAQLLQDASVRRQIVLVAQGAIRECLSPSNAAVDILASVQSSVLKIGIERSKGDAVHIAQVVTETLNEISSRCSTKTPTGVPSGFVDLDVLTGGFHPGELTVLAARPGVGKAQPLNACVLTPSGFVKMGEISIGSLVIGSDGLPHEVTGVFPQGIKPVFKVVFNDGASTECCNEHLWFTQTHNEQRSNRQGSVKQLCDIKQSLCGRDGRNNHHIPLVLPVELENDAEHLIHPWVVGAYLGDGSYAGKGTGVKFSNTEDDVIAKFANLMPSSDIIGNVCKSKNHYIKRKIRTNMPSSLGQSLQSYGLDGIDCFNKFVPQEYKYANASVRLEVLRGLLDTDGFVYNRGVEFTTASKLLAQDVVFLVRSLGGIVTQTERFPYFTVRGERKLGAKSYRLYLWFLNGVVPVSSAKHLAKYNQSESKHRKGRSFSSIEYVGDKECQCIAVDSPDHLYVTDDFVLTHNTAISMNILMNAAKTGTVGLFMSIEMRQTEVASRILCGAAEVNSNAVRKGTLTPIQCAKLTTAGGDVKVLPIWINDSPEQRVRSIMACARRLKSKEPLGLVVVDYLQLILPEDRRMPRQEQVSEMSRSLKLFARELDIPVICLAQLNRLAEDGDGPKLSHLRESGAVEQDADVVILLHRENERDSADVEIIRAIVAKNRNGPTGEVSLAYRKANLRFENYVSTVDVTGKKL